ncbi:MAG: ATP-binding protein [Proteobacteria bacterium]|nr:ATP-binding protein [Pseudomonadota bacterium]
MNFEAILKFLEDFHRDFYIENKIEAIKSLLKSTNINFAYLIINKQPLEIHKIIDENSNLILADLENNINKEVFQISENEKKIDIYNIQISDEQNVYGWLLISPNLELTEFTKVLKAELTCYLKQTLINQTYLKKAHQLETICLLSEKVSNFYDLKHLLDIVTEYVTKALNSKGTVIRLVNRNSNLLEVMSEYGLDDISIRRYGIKPGDGISGEVWSTKKPRLVIPDTEESKKLLDSKLKIRSLICVPLIFENEVTGTLSVYEKLSDKPFEEEDKIFLEVIAGLVSPLIAYSEALEREQNLTKQIVKNLENLHIITELNKIIMQPRKIDELLFLILTALTFGKDIGFNRAGLFMYNAQTGTFQGMIGVGCEHEYEIQVWEKLPDMTTVQWLELIEKNKIKNESTFNNTIRQVRFDISDFPIIIQILRSGSVYVSMIHERDIIKEKLHVEEYALVPLMGKEDLLGMLYVDNKFNKKPIDENYIRLLQTFASQAALAIENSRLYSEITNANELLKTAKQELLVKEKLATVGEMLTTLAHEIRNPLTAIGGFANIISKKTENPTVRELAEKIYVHASKMDNMFREFLLLAKHNTLSYLSIDINEIILDCIENFDYPNLKNISFVFNKTDNLIVNVDKNMIKVVINNLLKNAIQAMPKGGKIIIETKKENSYAVICVEDEGHGIPSDVLPNIFDPFYTTKFNGFGIGLSISYKIIKQHDGIIYAENKESGGAKFTVKLPLSTKEEAQNE